VIREAQRPRVKAIDRTWQHVAGGTQGPHCPHPEEEAEAEAQRK